MNIVDNKTMRGDHMIMIAVLSAASILMLYYGSLMTPTEVYLPISPSTLGHSHPEPKVTTTSTLAPTTTTTTTSTPKLRYLKKENPISQQDKNNLDNWYRKMTRIGTPLPKFEDINGGTIIDVGANVGVFSYNVRKICKDCRIMAFEAVPLFAKYIKTRKIGNIDVYPFGLSDKTGEADFWMSKDGNYGWNTMIPVEGGRKNMKKMKMNFKVFDDLNIDVGNLKLIKIDTEGAEYKVLRGLNKIIKKHKPILFIEFGFGKHHPAYKQVINEFDKLIDMGYTCNINYKNVRGTTDLVFEKKNADSIMIAIPTYNRIGYTKFHAKVIREYHKIPSSSLYIFDDCSTEYGEKELREWYGKDIHFFPCTKRLKSDANIRRMFEYFLITDFDLIFSVDTDLIFQRDWREFILKHIDATDGVMSLYHSNAPHHKTFNCKGDLCEKKSMGSAGTVMKKSIVKKMLQEHKNSMFDWGFVSIFKRRKIKMMIPNKSLIMHYGQIGQNNGCGSSEVAKGFDRTVLPKWIKDTLIFYFDKCNSPSVVYNGDKIVLNGIKIRKKYNIKTTDVIKYNTNGIPRYKKCAIVGSGPSLLDRLDGEEINSHDGVFRFNGAPTTNFEKYVGTKTTMRISYGTVCATLCCPDSVLTNILCADNLYPTVLKAVEKVLMTTKSDEMLHMSYPHWRTNYPRLTGMNHPKESTFMLFSNVNLFKSFKQSHLAHGASSGLKGILLGLTMCDSVTLYGFDLGKIEDNSIKNVRLHYYENWYLKRKVGHNFNKEWEFIKKLF